MDVGNGAEARLGLYIHVPFCQRKCPYCDFYSLPAQEEAMDAYTKAVREALAVWAGQIALVVDTIYFGGGTPSLLGHSRLSALLEEAVRRFSVAGQAEITLEANPAAAQAHEAGLVPPGNLGELFAGLRRAGFNRLSMGMQSATKEELRYLGRLHDGRGTARAVEMARRAGFSNISLDLMLGIPGQTPESAGQSAAFAARLGAQHLSCYLLKVEEGTPFAQAGVERLCPDEDQQADIYLSAVTALRSFGYRQYEVSNFCRPGYESRHNLKYWRCAPYLGIGPSAHSYLGGAQRFYYPRDLARFLLEPVGLLREEDDRPLSLRQLEPLGPPEADEYVMLGLRLRPGLLRADLRRRFPRMEEPLLAAAQPYVRAGLMELTEEAISLTPRGFLLSNSVIAALLCALEEGVCRAPGRLG